VGNLGLTAPHCRWQQLWALYTQDDAKEEDGLGPAGPTPIAHVSHGQLAHVYLAQIWIVKLGGLPEGNRGTSLTVEGSPLRSTCSLCLALRTIAQFPGFTHLTLTPGANF
jgi:hypothetical protein